MTHAATIHDGGTILTMQPGALQAEAIAVDGDGSSHI